MRITLLFEPSADRAIPFAVGPERYQRLADELGRYARAPVQIVHDFLRNAPPDAYVLFAGSGDLSRSLADCGAELAARLTPRLVLLDISWQKTIEQLEKYRLAGAIDNLRMSEWLARPSSSSGPFGLRYLAESLGATCVPLPALRSAHYCLLHSEQHRGLPHLLADYLTAYDRDQQQLGTLRSVSLARVRGSLAVGDDGNHQIAPHGVAITRPAAQVESVSIRRAIDSFRHARMSACLTLSQVAERSGLDLEQIRMLEGSNYPQATLGTLRACVLALQPKWGWTLCESGGLSLDQEPSAARTDEPSTPIAEVPWVLRERGMTFVGGRRIRRRAFGEELYESGSQLLKDDVHAGV